MLCHITRFLRAFGLCAAAALFLLPQAFAADTAYRIYSDSSRPIFVISKALDEGSAGILILREDNQSYALPVYRAQPGCTVTVEGTAAQLRVFPVELLGGEGSVRWVNEIAPSIGNMQVTLSDGVRSIAASEFRDYAAQLTGAYAHEVGAGYSLAEQGYYLVSHSEGGLVPNSVIVQVEDLSASASASASKPAAPTAPAAPAASNTTAAAPSAQAAPNQAPVLVNGNTVLFDAYTIQEGVNGFTYFKLRDLAAALIGTEKQYEVLWDKETESIQLYSGMPYSLVGGELAAGTSGTKTAKLSGSLIYKDSMAVSLTAYVIGQNTYFKLRDIGQLFDFSVSWDNDAMCIVIDTSKPYAT